MIKTLKELAKDTFTYGFASALGQIIGFLLLPIYTTHLSVRDYGVMAMITFISMFFTPLANLGITNAIFRRFNLHKEESSQIKSLSTGSIFVFFSSLVLLYLGFFFSRELTYLLVNDVKYEYLVKISLITSFFVSLAQVFTVVLRARRKVTQIATVRVIELLITIGFSVYFVVALKLGIEGIVKGALIGSVFGCLMQYILCFKMIKFKLKIDELKELLKYGLPFLPHRLMSFGLGFVSQFFIKEFIGLEETGLYNIAFRFTLPLGFIIGSVQSAWVPIKFQTHREEGSKSAVIFRQLISFYFIILILLYSGSAILGPELLRLMTASEYHNAVYILPFVLLVPFSRGIYYMLGTGFEFTKNTKPMPLVSGAGIIALFVIGYFSLDALGIYGIILGLIASWIVMASVIRYFAVTRFFVPINLKLIVKLFILAVLLGFTVYLIQNKTIGIRLIVETILVIFSISVFIKLILDNKDLESLDIKKYPIFSKLYSFLLPILNSIKNK